MKAPAASNGCASALFTDLYELTMACAYWKSGKASQEAVFELFFRRPPFQSGFTVAAGLEPVIDFLNTFCFTDDDAAFLGALTADDRRPLLDGKFLDYLKGLKLSCDVHAVPEGTIVFPKEPLLRVQGPILQCQLLETAALNLINFQTLVVTKAARVCLAAQGEPVVEFGLRRAQGADRGLAASRAAYIGGCESTSNVLAAKLLNIPVRGTHGHSWVMSFDDEPEAFRAYAEAMPNNCVFLVDTYDTLEGVRHAVEAGRRLREQGQELGGIRLDSGDLAWLSIEARKILDEAGFPNAVIFASNNLDEHIIASLKGQGAKINAWGVGTKLVTAFDDPALGGVYKLAAVRGKDGRWNYKLKLSEQSAKVTNPGIHQVRRFRSDTEFLGDGVYDLQIGAPENFTIVDPLDPTRRKRLPPGAAFEDLLVPVFAQGRQVYQPPPLADIRRRTQALLGMFHSGVKRFINPHQYPVGLELGLHELKMDLVPRAREKSSGP